MWRETHHNFRQFWIRNSLEANSQRTLHLALFKKQDYSAAYCLLNTMKWTYIIPRPALPEKRNTKQILGNQSTTLW